MKRTAPDAAKANKQLRERVRELEARLAEAQETIAAIRAGQVDAIIVSGGMGEQVYTLQGAERPYRTMIEAINEGALTLNSERIVLYCNTRFASLLGMSIEEVIAHRMEEFIDPDDLERFRNFFATAFQKPRREEFRLHGRIAFPLPVLVSSSIIGVGEQSDVCMIVTDLREYKALEKANDDIQQKLMQHQQMTFLGQLTSGVAHEVRNPLHAISSIIEALFSEIEGRQDLAEYRLHLQSQVDRLTRLMDDLLKLGRQVHSSQFVEVPVVSICKDAAELWEQSTAHRSPLRFAFDGSAEHASVLGDREKLRQVFINLLENASQHSPPNSEIVVRGSVSPDTVVTIDITDRGTGIRPEHLSHIFNPFFTTRKEGTGLGLMIVKSILLNHGGAIEIRNNDPPPGTTATVSLPLLRKEK
jgi:PAS domain S-box-containing protein